MPVASGCVPRCSPGNSIENSLKFNQHSQSNLCRAASDLPQVGKEVDTCAFNKHLKMWLRQRYYVVTRREMKRCVMCVHIRIFESTCGILRHLSASTHSLMERWRAWASLPVAMRLEARACATLMAITSRKHRIRTLVRTNQSTLSIAVAAACMSSKENVRV